MDAKHPRYRFCPTECEQGFHAARQKKCEGCPAKTADESFERRTVELWRRVLGPKAYRYRFDRLLMSFYRAMDAAEDESDKVSVRMARLASIYRSEDRYHRDQQRYSDRQKAAK